MFFVDFVIWGVRGQKRRQNSAQTSKMSFPVGPIFGTFGTLFADRFFMCFLEVTVPHFSRFWRPQGLQNRCLLHQVWGVFCDWVNLWKRRSRCRVVAKVENRIPMLHGSRCFFWFPCWAGMRFSTFAAPPHRECDFSIFSTPPQREAVSYENAVSEPLPWRHSRKRRGQKIVIKSTSCLLTREINQNFASHENTTTWHKIIHFPNGF